MTEKKRGSVLRVSSADGARGAGVVGPTPSPTFPSCRGETSSKVLYPCIHDSRGPTL